MKKRAAVYAVLLGVTLALAGCSSGGPVENQYIKITKYKGVEVPAVEGYSEVEDDAVERRIEEIMDGFAEYNQITDRPVQEGDTIFVNYTAVVDGEVIEDESGTEYQAVVGLGSLYEGFDEDVTGKNVGESFVKTEKFSDDYSDETLAGKTMELTITVTRIFEKELPELTDEFVQTVSQESKTVEEYKKEVKAIMEEAVEEAEIEELMESVWNVVLENSEIIAYPEAVLTAEIDELYDYYQQGADVYQMEFDAFLEEVMGLTEEEFVASLQIAAETNVKNDLIVELICAEENITLTEEEMAAAQEELAEEMGYEDVDAMIEDAGADAVEKYVMRDVVKRWLAENCIQVKE